MNRLLDVVVVDHHDSYTWNLVHLVAAVTGSLPAVVQHDEVSAAEVLAFSHVVLSPGPGHPASPADFSVGREVLRRATRPVLGVCLGMQGLVTTYGGTVDRAPELLHGKTSSVHHKGAGVLAGLPDPFTATRYHSLTVLPDTVPAEFEVTGETDTGVVMGMRHRELPIEGVQFHPESVLTEGGHRMLANWLRTAGFEVPEDRVRELENAMRTLADAAARP